MRQIVLRYVKVLPRPQACRTCATLFLRKYNDRCLRDAGMASADVQRKLLRTGQGVLAPDEGLAALRWILLTNGRGADPQVSSQPHGAPCILREIPSVKPILCTSRRLMLRARV